LKLQNKPEVLQRTGKNHYWHNIMGNYGIMMKNAYKFPARKYEQTIWGTIL
jgi:hypothetical protein